MDWRCKAAVLTALSRVRGGEGLNYLFQRHVTRSLPTPPVEFPRIVAFARRHLELLSRHTDQDLSHARFYEFGAGHDLIVPLAFYCFGVSHQILTDLWRHARPHLVSHAVDTLRTQASMLGLLRLPDAVVIRADTMESVLFERLGIEYQAPVDARGTGLPSETVDCVTSTNTLEHISLGDIGPILAECARILRPRGLLSLQIDYQDHYAYFDSRISVYNFLRYSDRRWSRWNPALHFQNRLRHRDYLPLFDAAGLEVEDEYREEATAADLELISHLRVDARFASYSPSELGTRYAVVLLRKR